MVPGQEVSQCHARLVTLTAGLSLLRPSCGAPGGNAWRPSSPVRARSRKGFSDMFTAMLVPYGTKHCCVPSDTEHLTGPL